MSAFDEVESLHLQLDCEEETEVDEALGHLLEAQRLGALQAPFACTFQQNPIVCADWGHFTVDCAISRDTAERLLAAYVGSPASEQCAHVSLIGCAPELHAELLCKCISSLKPVCVTLLSCWCDRRPNFTGEEKRAVRRLAAAMKYKVDGTARGRISLQRR